MVCTTFLHDGELNQLTTDGAVNEALREVREATGENWQVIERTFDHIPWWLFWKPQTYSKTYELYIEVGGVGPWQQINFYRAGTNWSINLRNPADVVVAYLYGILTGVHNANRKAESQRDFDGSTLSGGGCDCCNCQCKS